MKTEFELILDAGGGFRVTQGIGERWESVRGSHRSMHTHR
jgi:hypothetical protein